MALQSVDEVHPIRVEFADGDPTREVTDKDILSLLVELKSRASRVTDVSSHAATTFRAMKLEVTEQRNYFIDSTYTQLNRNRKILWNLKTANRPYRSLDTLRIHWF